MTDEFKNLTGISDRLITLEGAVMFKRRAAWWPLLPAWRFSLAVEIGVDYLEHGLIVQWSSQEL